MKMVEGRSRTAILVNSLTLLVGGIPVTSCTPFFIEAVVDFAPYVEGSSEEPAQEEWMELSGIHVATHLYLSNDKGLSLAITPQCDLGELLCEQQYEQLILCLKKQSAGFVTALGHGI